MKIAFVISGNYFKAHIWFYIYLFDKYNIEYDIISWNRLKIEEPNCIQFNCSEGESYLSRLFSYLRYRKFVLDLLKQGKYDKVFVSTIAIGLLIYPYLKKVYFKRYIIDIRDNSITASIMKTTFKNLIKNSFLTAISSNGYLKWLPPSENYFIAHNYPFTINTDIELIEEINKFEPKSLFFNIVTIGSLRDYNENRFLIESFKNSNYVNLKFIGSGPAESALKEYVKNNNINNVYFHGFYDKYEELDLLQDASFINILVGNDSNSKTLITNRFYLSVILGTPMIVNDDTHQGYLCKKHSLGCDVNTNKPLLNQLQAYLESFDSQKYDKGRKEFIKTVALDMNKIEKEIEKFLMN